MRILILRNAQDETLRYDLAQVNEDMADYHLAGTLSGAFRVVEADLHKRGPWVEATVQDMKTVGNVVLNLSAGAATDKASLTRSLDAQRVNAAIARKVLAGLGVASADVPATLEDRREMRQDIVRPARTAEQIATVRAAFKRAGLVK